MEKNLVRQHNCLTTARYEMSSLEKDIMYIILARIDSKFSFKTNFKIPLKDIMKLKELKKIKGLEIREAAKALIGRSLTIFNVDNKKYETIGVLTNSNYEAGILTIEFDKSLCPFLFNYKNRFTLFSLRTALKLKSKYSKRLYEMLSQYKDTGIFTITIKDLKERLELIKDDGRKEKYKEFNALRKYVIDMAMNELKQVGDINFTYVAKKTKNKYTNLEFKIFPKESVTKFSDNNFETNKQNKRLNNSKYPNKELPKEAVTIYMALTKEYRWFQNNKALAYKLASIVPSIHLHSHIGKVKFKIQSGEKVSPVSYFKDILEKFVSKS